MAEQPEEFVLLGKLRNIEVIARGRGIREQRILKAEYGGKNWRKLKGIGRVSTDWGYIGEAEIHWYSAHGVGDVKWKIKKQLE